MANQSNRIKISNVVKNNNKNISVNNKYRKTTQKAEPKHPTLAFIEKSENAIKKLETKIGEELRKQLSDLFETENFSDTSIIRGKFNKRVHSCLLLTRIPRLFRELLNLNLNRNCFNETTNEYNIRIPPEIKEKELKNLLQRIYSEYSSEEMEREENDLISKIEILNKSFISDEKHNGNEDQLKSNMYSSDEYVLNSDIPSDEEHIKCVELDSNDNNEDNGNDSTKTNQLVRSGTFELLSSIYSEDKYDLKDDNKRDFNKDSDLLETNEQNNDLKTKTNESFDEKSNDNSNKNSMFSLFIDLNEPLDNLSDNQRPKTTKDDKRKGFDFIPLNSDLIKSESKPRTRYSAGAVLMRSFDSMVTNTETQEDIQLLPMSPIVRQKPENDRKFDKKDNYIKHKKYNSLAFDGSERHCHSSSDSFSEAFNECLNISIQSSSKNSYESDSIDVFDEKLTKQSLLYDSDEEQLSDDANDSSDWDLNDSQTIRNMKSCSKLGEDLLKMFVQQSNTDITIKVSDREIRSHRCILTSRCRYFEAMLSGNWIESDSNTIDLQGFTHKSVYFALCHIYSGCLTLPPKVDLSELALLSDVLAMDSLKEIVVHELLVNRCHFFHSPCSDNCIISVIKCLKLCSRSGLNDLYNKCLNWVSKYFTRVWSNKTFSTLKPHLMDACLQSKVKQLMPENVLKTTLECERMITAIPRVKWAEPVFTLLAKLIEVCCDYIANNYNQVITSKDFLALGRSNSWDISNIEQTLLAAMTKLSPDISCKTLIELNKILLLQEKDQMNDGFSYGPFNKIFGQLVSKMQRFCERYMIQNANRVVNCQSWLLLTHESQQKIRDGAVIVFEFEKPIASPPRLSSAFIPKVKKSNESLITDKNSDNYFNVSKGAVPKVRSKISTTKLNQKPKPDPHIYDTVPFENITSNKAKISDNKRPESRKTEKVSNKALSLHLKSRQNKEKIAKVSPFSVKTQNNEQNSTHIENKEIIDDLVAEIDAESNLVTHCLQEAELLEQQLTRKFSKINTQSSGADNKSKAIQQITRSVKRDPKDNGIKKTVPKTSRTSTSVPRSKALIKVQNQRK